MGEAPGLQAHTKACWLMTSPGGMGQSCIPGALEPREISLQPSLTSGHVQLCVVGECRVLTRAEVHPLEEGVDLQENLPHRLTSEHEKGIFFCALTL